MSLLLSLRLTRESGAFGVCRRSAVLSPSSCPHPQLQSLVGMHKETRQAQSRNQRLMAVAPGLRDGAGNLLDGCEAESGQDLWAWKSQNRPCNSNQFKCPPVL